VSDFDGRFGVDTDGAMDGTTSLRDLDTPHPGWIHGSDYIAASVVKFHRALSSLTIPSGRVHLRRSRLREGASRHAGVRISGRQLVGIDFSHELIATALRN